MKAFIVIALIACASAVGEFYQTQALIDEINDSGASWTAGHNQFSYMTTEEKQEYMGLIMDVEALPSTPNVEADVLKDFITLPASFDSRTQWKGCVHAVRDQQRCGSCWAFSASEVLSDRTCIEGGDNVVLSAQDMVSCDHRDHGCQGGALQYAWMYLEDEGIVPDKCYPYTSGAGSQGVCDSHCTGSGEWKKYRARDSNSFPSVSAIKQEVFTNGPVQTGFYVYEDFMQYTSGVYKWNGSGQRLGGHAVKIVGWGHDSASNLDYWIVANSWNTSWGLEGFFWFAQGQSKLLFEEMCYSGKAKV